LYACEIYMHVKHTIFDVCAENWHIILSTILSLHITICLIFKNVKSISMAINPKSASKNRMLIEIYMHVKHNYSRCVCRKLTQNIKYNLSLHTTICLIFENAKSISISISIALCLHTANQGLPMCHQINFFIDLSSTLLIESLALH